jgi:predicted Rossmann fold nucleotide-binding protein DprA/Smf involved in DNA uptake
VFALPGKIDDLGSDGPNELIREGAYAVLCSDDILKRYEFLYGDVIDGAKLSRAKRRISDGDADRALKKYGVASKELPRSRKKRAYDGEESFDLEAKLYASEEKLKSEKTEKVEKTENQEQKQKKSLEDDSATMLESLDDFTRRVFESIPIDKAISPDLLAAQGFDVSAAITSLTMLELYGLVSALPGGLYVRK